MPPDISTTLLEADCCYTVSEDGTSITKAEGEAPPDAPYLEYSEREQAKQIIDCLPEYKISQLLLFLQGMQFDDEIEDELGRAGGGVQRFRLRRRDYQTADGC